MKLFQIVAYIYMDKIKLLAVNDQQHTVFVS